MSRTAEWLALIVISLVWFGMNLPMLDRRPVVYIDECSYGDPGINLHLGKGFVSTCWYSQDVHSFWSSNSPAYAFALSGWLDLFGFSLYNVRLFGLLLIFFSFLLLYWTAARLKIIESPSLRLIAFIVLLSTLETTLNARRGRYDTIMIFAVALAALAASIPSPKGRRIGLFLAASTFAWCGLPLLTYSAVMGVLAFLLAPRARFFDVLSFGLGSCAGLASLVGFFKYKGTFEYLMASVNPHTTAGGFSVWETIARDPVAIQLYFMIGPGLGLLLLLSVVLFITSFGRSDLGPDPVGRYLLIASFIVPVALVASGKFIQDYNWMAIVPAVAFVCRESERQRRSTYGTRLVPRFAPVAALFLVFFQPFYLALGILEYRARDYQIVRNAVKPHVEKDQWVYCGWPAYYAIKEAGGWPIPGCYNAGYRAMDEFSRNLVPKLDPEVAKKITLIAIEPAYKIEDVTAMLGGKWEKIVDTRSKERPAPPKIFGRSLYAKGYEMLVYKRTE